MWRDLLVPGLCATLIVGACSGCSDRRPEAPLSERTREVLTELARWDSATSEERRAAAEEVEGSLPDFDLLRMEAFSCGGQTHEVALFRHDATRLEFVLVPVGTFRMGSPPSRLDPHSLEPLHDVTLTKPFLIARTECTQAAWDRIGGKDRRWRQGANFPIEHASWSECDAWCGRAGLRLPTEAEWEYACRAGTTTTWSTGDDVASLQGYANIADAHASASGVDLPVDPTHLRYTLEVDDCFATEAPVGSFKPNAFGLYDMHGNVLEYCLDVFELDIQPMTAVTDPIGRGDDDDSRVMRGGSWSFEASGARSADRWPVNPESDGAFATGFRPAKAIDLR